MRFAVGDVHGFRGEVRAALQAAGLIDAHGDWSGGQHEVWFMGDLMDRGPDGVGVVADVMRWQRQAADAGGVVGSVLGNHEVLALGFRRFRDVQLAARDPLQVPRSFVLSWLVNGGQLRDQELLTDEMADWMSGLPAIARVGDDTLVHADTLEYLRFGDDLDSINAMISGVLHSDELEPTWELWGAMTDRYAFLDEQGPAHACDLLGVIGGARIVHGHSTISDLTDMEPALVTGPWAYADGLALAVDGGIYAGGPSLVVPLDRE
jgi:hypothetical protein